MVTRSWVLSRELPKNFVDWIKSFSKQVSGKCFDSLQCIFAYLKLSGTYDSLQFAQVIKRTNQQVPWFLWDFCIVVLRAACHELGFSVRSSSLSYLHVGSWYTCGAYLRLAIDILHPKQHWRDSNHCYLSISKLVVFIQQLMSPSCSPLHNFHPVSWPGWEIVGVAGWTRAANSFSPSGRRYEVF